LEAAQGAQLEEAPDVERVGRGVKAGVDGEVVVVVIVAVEAADEVRLGLGHLVDQAAEGEILRERGHAFQVAIRAVRPW
jgi:hypothetical protein